LCFNQEVEYFGWAGHAEIAMAMLMAGRHGVIDLLRPGAATTAATPLFWSPDTLGRFHFLSGTQYCTTKVTTCVIAAATAGVQVLAWGTNWMIRTVTALANTPALTFAVGAQLLVCGCAVAGCA
jgi:hypothetical protein